MSAGLAKHGHNNLEKAGRQTDQIRGKRKTIGVWF